MRGKVLRSTGSWYEILTEDKKIVQGRLRGKIRLKDQKITNPIAVGDNVIFAPDPRDPSTVVIEDIEPRENYIIRKSVQKAAFGHMIAANVDQTILVVTLLQPRTSLGFIDRFLVSAEAFRIPAVLVFNKIDLYDDELNEYQDLLKAVYTDLDYKCLSTSVIERKGFEEFRNILDHKISLVSGHSGAGKSSLINSIAPNLQIRTGEISNYSDKGVHTTTFAEMHLLDETTSIIDTPGIKELGLYEIEKEELAHYFPEMRNLLGECKFNNCQHTHEPGCAVINAVENGEIFEGRYHSYLSMLNDSDNRR